jgi:hypothetical protein
MRRLTGGILLALALVVAAPAAAHDESPSLTAADVYLGGTVSSGIARGVPAGALPGGARLRQVPATPAGPCTEAAKDAMPAGEGHAHAEITQHRFACRMEQLAFLDLKRELADRDNVILGEMDVAAGIAAVAITFPRAGVLFFDVSEPAGPKFLSRYDGPECDQLITDINCGAFVSLAPDGKTAFLSVQTLTGIGAIPPHLNRPGVPGVEVIDLADPARPGLSQIYPIAGQGGIHTVRFHTIPDGPSSADKPRAPGEYVISNQNGVGIDIARVSRVNGKRSLATVRQANLAYPEATIVNNEVHDTFIQNDPLDGRTYLYNAAGFDTGFHVYDITDPERLKLVAEWDLTPACREDWYAHTIDVTHRGGRRYVTMPAELFLKIDRNSASGFQEQAAAEQQLGCGKFVGNGDQHGPLWIVDATDFSKLGPAADLESTEERARVQTQLKSNSEKALVATWTNPAGRAAGSLTFSPHNQQIIGDRILLSHYHGGVYMLDASAAFAGKRERPRELGFIVPSSEPTRPLLGQPLLMGVLERFFTDFPFGRPEIWDAVEYKGVVLAADMTGGFYALRYKPRVLAAPRLSVRLRGSRRARCDRRRIAVQVRGEGIRRVDVIASGRRVARLKRAPFTRTFRRARLGRGRVLRAVVTLEDGRVVKLRKRLGACGR